MRLRVPEFGLRRESSLVLQKVKSVFRDVYGEALAFFTAINLLLFLELEKVARHAWFFVINLIPFWRSG